jgi:hypothetical protein
MWATIYLLGILGSGLWVINPRPGQGRGRGRPQGIMMLLQNSSAQEELGMSDEEKRQAVAAAQEVRARFQDQLKTLAGLGPRERLEKGPELQDKVSQAVHSALADVLSSHQLKRLRELELQVQALRAFANPSVQSLLRLTDEQKARLRAMMEEVGRKVQALQREPGGGGQQKIAALRKEGMREAIALLTDEQRPIWNSLSGEPFEIRFPPRGPGNGPRRPGPHGGPFSLEEDDDF